MLRKLVLTVVAALATGVGISAAAPPPADGPGGPPRVLTVELDGAITVGTTEVVQAALARADAEGFAAVLFQLDTPGGALEATRTIVRAMLESRVAVLVWVGPAGARAGSAGVFLTLAADVAAMHPTSNIGAAHPVLSGGRDVEDQAGKEMARKVENDTAAQVRSIAAARGRNADWAEKAVRESVSVTADVAVKERVVDFLAATPAAMVAQADGRTIRPKDDPRTLRLAGASLVAHEPTIRQRFLMFIANPNVVAILSLLGLLGLGIEFYNPGGIVPGVVGGICLFLVFVSAQVIPVNVAAVLLLIAGAGLLVAEAYLTTHGIAAVGGAVLMVIGMLFLLDTDAPGQAFDPGSFSISPWVVWPTPVALALLFGFMGWKVARSRSMPLQLGAAALVGAIGDALSDIGPEGGEAFVHGEYWRAKSAGPIARGARVRVLAVDGLVLSVEEDRASQ
ncbi:MAG TPA: nodulation protein NfeD [Anaeromyxobacter sp.]|nr:nodulation protein NfeD [Anaeromyxobacter sp.]